MANRFGDVPNFSSVPRLEDSACRAALRAVGARIPALMRSLNVPVTEKLTFSQLVERTDFPIRPAVLGCDGTPCASLMYGFPKTRFWTEWVAAWDARPIPQKQRYAIFRGSDETSWIAYLQLTDNGYAIPPSRPHLCFGHSVGITLVGERFTDWVRQLSWRGGDFCAIEPSQAEE